MFYLYFVHLIYFYFIYIYISIFYCDLFCLGEVKSKDSKSGVLGVISCL